MYIEGGATVDIAVAAAVDDDWAQSSYNIILS
jgi:hypothetical protein